MAKNTSQLANVVDKARYLAIYSGVPTSLTITGGTAQIGYWSPSADLAKKGNGGNPLVHSTVPLFEPVQIRANAAGRYLLNENGIRSDKNCDHSLCSAMIFLPDGTGTGGQLILPDDNGNGEEVLLTVLATGEVER
ncbi:GspH/FimT family pseudopilin [Parahaliea aestuarii]|nr:GspH/FimT family pseudopilin [Parahaliea aestuarii]